SGTTAYVAEQWGRRWITVDTSRVAIAIAKQRILTARYEFYDLRPVSLQESTANPNNRWLTDSRNGMAQRSTLKCRSTPRVTIAAIARNQNLDSLFLKHEPIVDARLKACNEALSKMPQDVRFKLDAKLLDKQRKEGKRAITDADKRRWQLPKKGD